MRNGAVMDCVGRVVTALLGMCACGFNPSGVGSGGAMVGDGDDTASSGEPQTSTGVEGTSQAEGDVTASPDESSGDPSSSSSSEGGNDDDDTTTGEPVDPCAGPPPVTFEIDVTQAMLSGPMQIDVSGSEGMYAYSEVAGQGRASFQFMVPCAAEFRAWARVYDPKVGFSAINWTDPDSFLVAFDGEPNTEWWYGCQTFDEALGGSVWASPMVVDNPDCDEASFSRLLTAGTHLLHLTNREAGNHSMQEVAAVTRVFVSSDPAFAPP
jgi:hypothetical protein